MQLELEQVGVNLVVRLSGELDHHTSSRFRETVEAELNKEIARNLILNLKGLTFMDSSGLGVILGRYNQVKKSGGRLVICSVSPSAKKIIELSGLPRLVSLYRDEKEAIKKIQE